MLTQDDLVASNMSGEGALQRSSWKAEAIRRGDLKISGPFPITEEMPLNDDEEREYAEKHNVDPPSPLLDALPDPSLPPTQPPPPVPPPVPPLVSSNNGSQRSVPEEIEEQEPVQLDEEKHKLEPQKLSGNGSTPGTAAMQKQSSPEPTTYNSPSPFPSIPESSTRTTPKKKRKSGLRNVFRKMFGRKSKDEPHNDEAPVTRHGHHRSVPIALHESPKMTREDVSRPRISDLQVRELEPINPLGQHLPFPMNVNAPAEASPPQEYLTFEIPPLGRRRATLPSVLLSDAEAQALAAVIASGEGKHLPTWEERHEGESIPSPNKIGIALSSPPHSAQSVQAKRRSQSAGALRDLAKTRPSIERRRSEEIRYWRNSYQSGSIYSVATPRPRTAQTMETVRTIGTHDTVAKESEPAAESGIADVPIPIVAQHDQDIGAIPLPVDAFNFGNLRTAFSDDGQEAASPDVTARSEKRLSIEDRVKGLEDTMRNLETSVRRISGRSNRQTIILENAPKGRRSRNRSSSATSDRQSSHHSSKNSQRTVSIQQEGSGPPSPTLGPLSAVNEFPQSNDRRETVIAVEPSAIRPPTAQQSDIAAQFVQILEALQHERGARKALENQVNSLQREVAELHAIVTKFIARSPSYPTPSPDAIIVSNEERLSTPRAAPRAERGLGFESDDGTPATSRNTRETIISRFSRSDSEAGDYSVTSSREDITSPEAWATPKEESGFSSGFFSRNKSQDEMF